MSVIVHRTGKKAVIVLTIHCEPPCTRAWVIAVATSSGFIVSFLAFLVAAIPHQNGSFSFLLITTNIWSPLDCVRTVGGGGGGGGFRYLRLTSRPEGVVSGDSTYDGQQGDRDIGDAYGPTGIAARDQEIADRQELARGDTVELDAKDVGDKVEDGSQPQQATDQAKVTQVVVGISHQFHQQDPKQCRGGQSACKWQGIGSYNIWEEEHEAH